MIQMNHRSIFVLGPPIFAGIAVGLPLKYVSEHGGVSRQEVLVYFENRILDLSKQTQ
jgi:hypothetical protein